MHVTVKADYIWVSLSVLFFLIQNKITLAWVGGGWGHVVIVPLTLQWL